jgi:hypothetical protein
MDGFAVERKSSFKHLGYPINTALQRGEKVIPNAPNRFNGFFLPQSRSSREAVKTAEFPSPGWSPH